MLEAIHKFRSGPVVLAEALHGVTPEESTRIPAPGKWNINQIVRHVTDTELVVAVRLRLIIAEERPTLSTFDQDLWANSLGYESANPLADLALFTAVRNSTTAILETLPPEAFDRVSFHPERGEQTLLDWVVRFSNHVSSHADQIKKLRA